MGVLMDDWEYMGSSDTESFPFGLRVGPGEFYYAPLPPKRNRYKDRLARGELIVKTPNGVGGRHEFRS